MDRPSKLSGKGGCVFFLGLPLCRFASACSLGGLGSPGSCSPGVCPVCGLVFRCLSLVAFDSPCGRRPEDRHSVFLRYPLGSVSLPTPCGIDCQGAATSSRTSVRCSGRNFGMHHNYDVSFLVGSTDASGPVCRDESLTVLCIVTGVSMFWDFGS